MKRTYITVMETDSGKYPNLRKNYPYSYKINGRDWPDKKEKILTNIAGYLMHNPYNFIVFRNKLPEKEALGKTLDTLVKTHNLKKKLIGGEKTSEKEFSGMTLEDLIKGHNLILKLGVGITFFRLRKAKKFLREIAEE